MYIRPTRLLEDGSPNARFNADKKLRSESISLDKDNNDKIKEAIAMDKNDKDEKKDL